ncbi:MAG: S8 family serine peptidase [Ornithinimicrobium sp.]
MSTTTNDTPGPAAPAELVVITTGAGAAAPEHSALGAAVAQHGLDLRPLFAGLEPDQQVDAEGATAPGPAEVADVANWFFATGAEADLQVAAESLRQRDDVEAAYVKPPAEPATVDTTLAPPDLAELFGSSESSTTPAPEAEAPAAGNYVSRQNYLGAAPVGIDAAYGWSRPGGRGEGIRVIDCEWGWQLDHHDLAQNNGGLVGGTNDASTHHGTAVMGVIGGDHNSFGVHGISPNARLSASSVNGQGTAGAMVTAAQNLSAGDVLLIEMHRRGPNGTQGGQQGFVAMEWWPDDFAAIRYAVGRGIVVVEAAGNGWEDLDQGLYDTPAAGFPASWKNPFNPANPSSSAVMVGAGSPPAGTHGRSTSPWGLPYVDRARCGFSNYGSRIDAQGWGWEVTTCGYGDLYDGGGATQLYTDVFSGTSSASPIVVGALTVTQGVLKAANMPLMTSDRARQLLRATGSAQQPAPQRPTSQRIGNRPNLRQLIPAALRQTLSVKITHTYAISGAQQAWAHLEGYGWRRIDTGSADGVSNTLLACLNAQLRGTKVGAHVDNTILYYVFS